MGQSQQSDTTKQTESPSQFLNRLAKTIYKKRTTKQVSVNSSNVTQENIIALLLKSTYHSWFQIRNGFYEEPRPLAKSLCIDAAMNNSGDDCFDAITLQQQERPKKMLWVSLSQCGMREWIDEVPQFSANVVACANEGRADFIVKEGLDGLVVVARILFELLTSNGSNLFWSNLSKLVNDRRHSCQCDCF